MRLSLFCTALIALLSLAAACSAPGSAWLPPCLFRQWTGLLCYGCGSTRALHALAQGDILDSLRCNLLLLPTLGWLLALCWLKGRAFSISLCCGIGCLALFMLLRNLPWPAFDCLRP